MLPADSVDQLVHDAMYKQSTVTSLCLDSCDIILPLELEKLDSVSFIYLQHCARCLNLLMP